MVDRRHRRVALENLERVFGKEFDEAQRFAIAKENFRRLGENYACTVKTPFMPREAVEARLEWSGVDDALRSETRNIVGVVGHFGNFELYARTADQLPGRRFGTTCFIKPACFYKGKAQLAIIARDVGDLLINIGDIKMFF